MSSSFVDLHAHYLPGLDDGSPSLDVSLQMVSAARALGFHELHATPHQRAGMYMPDREMISAAAAALASALAHALPDVTLSTAAENFWDDVLVERLRAGGLPTYAGGRAFLFELNPALAPPRLEQTLFDLRVGGRLPVMAHPERYLAVQADLARAESFGRSAALVVDLAALDGAHGRVEMKTARRLVEDGLAHAAATDIHGPDDQRAVAAGLAWIRKRLGADALERLLAENPRRILAGELP